MTAVLAAPQARAALYHAAADLTPPTTAEPEPRPWRCPRCGAPIVAGTALAIWCWAGHATRIDEADRG